MCGRFAQISEEEELMKSFSVQTSKISPTPSFNIAPGSEVTVILEEEGLRKMTLRRWGLVPFWARKDGRQEEAPAVTHGGAHHFFECLHTCPLPPKGRPVC